MRHSERGLAIQGGRWGGIVVGLVLVEMTGW